MSEERIKLERLVNLMEELEEAGRTEEAATLYWAIAKLELYFDIKW